jgi:acyl carrier protein
MTSPAPSPTLATAAAAEDPEQKIRHLPAAAQAAFRRFRTEHDPAALDPVIFAILDDYVPTPPARPLAESAGTTRLVEDLGFDSLAIIEVAFFTEDLFGISIANEEIVQVRTLDDLRGFVRRKIAERPAN